VAAVSVAAPEITAAIELPATIFGSIAVAVLGATSSELRSGIVAIGIATLDVPATTIANAPKAAQSGCPAEPRGTYS